MEEKRKKQSRRDATDEEEAEVGYEDGRIVFKEIAKRKREENDEEAEDLEE